MRLQGFLGSPEGVQKFYSTKELDFPNPEFPLWPMALKMANFNSNSDRMATKLSSLEQNSSINSKQRSLDESLEFETRWRLEALTRRITQVKSEKQDVRAGPATLTG